MSTVYFEEIDLDVEELEEVIAPRIHVNHNETLKPSRITSSASLLAVHFLRPICRLYIFLPPDDTVLPRISPK